MKILDMKICDLKKKAQSIKNKYPVYIKYNDDDFNFIKLIIELSKEKREYLIKHGQVVRIFTGEGKMNTTCIWFECSDGSTTAFSLSNISGKRLMRDENDIELPTENGLFDKALRELISNQIYNWKNLHSKAGYDAHHDDDHPWTWFSDKVKETFGNIPVYVDNSEPGKPKYVFNTSNKIKNKIIKAHSKYIEFGKIHAIKHDEHLAHHKHIKHIREDFTKKENK